MLEILYAKRGDIMPHKELIRIIPGAKTAVLFLHGICGSPNHFRSLLPLEAAVPDDWSLYNIVLDGHCKTVEAFGRSSMKKWKAQVESVFDALARTHERVILVGHSMGTLFSIDLALRHPEKIPFAFLIAVPVRVAVRPHAVGYMLRIAFDRVGDKNPVLISMRQACGLMPTKKLWKYIPWAPRMVELLRLCSQTGKVVSELRVPCIAWQSERDEMVSRRAGNLLRESGRVEVHNLPKSTHFYYPPEEAKAISDSFLTSCKQLI